MSEPKTKMTLLLTPAERARLDALRLARGDRSAAATLRALVRDAGGDTTAACPGARLEERAAALRAKLEDGTATKRDRRDLLDAMDKLQGLLAQKEAREGSGLMAEIARTQIALLRKLDKQLQDPPSEPDDPGLPEPVDLDVPAARADFLARVGCSPEEYLRRWRAGQIPDTGEGMYRYMRALMLEESPEDAYACRILEEVHHAAADALAAELGHPLPPRPPPAASAAESAAAVAALLVQAMPRWPGLDPGGGSPPDPLTTAHVRGAARAARELADALEQIAERA